MKKKTLRNNYFICLIAIFMALCTAFAAVQSPANIYSNVNAANKFTSVMDDLNSDSSFKIADYPNLSVDYLKGLNNDQITTNDKPFIEVMQIAESSSRELFVYTYQPTDTELDLTANAISISRIYSSDGQNMEDIMVYDLELVSTVSVFDKYLVKGFEVNNDPYRYYNLITIYRNYSPEIDVAAGGSELENYAVGEHVGQQWCVYYKNSDIVYEMATFETMDITVNYTGNVSFKSGLTLGNLLGSFQKGDAWFIAFNVDDYIVKRIYDADLIYKKRSATSHSYSSEVQYSEWSEDIKITLFDTDQASYVNEDAIFATRYTWNRISAAQSFITNIEKQGITFTENAKTALNESQWVFAFCETERNDVYTSQGSFHEYTDISDVTILRIHFLDNTGKIYNLGVVSDRVNPDDTTDGTGNDKKTIDWITAIFILVLFTLFVVLCQYLGILPIVKKVLWFIIKWTFKIAFYIISSPYYLIKWIATGKIKD